MESTRQDRYALDDMLLQQRKARRRELDLMQRLGERRRDRRAEQRLIGVDPIAFPLERIGRQCERRAAAGRVDFRSCALLDDGAGKLRG